MNTLFAPGCGLNAYKPELTKKVERFLLENEKIDGLHLTCCHSDPMKQEKTTIVNTCAGCDRRFRHLYENVATISLWEIIADMDSFPFPDYDGVEMSVALAQQETKQEYITLYAHC